MTEKPPPDFVPRPVEFEALITQLLDEKREKPKADNRPLAITAALRGAGGYGKTTLAKAVCHDERVKAAFCDGILWVTLGQEPNIMAGLVKVYDGLVGERPAFGDIEDAAQKVDQAWADRSCLLVIDDVWNAAHLRPFLRGGTYCARLITTRDSQTLPLEARQVKVDEMLETEAVALLSAGLELTGFRNRAALRRLADRLGEWPLLLKLANGVLRERLNRGQKVNEALTWANKALDRRGLTAFDSK